MAAGCRVRLLLEWYDPEWDQGDGEHLLAHARAQVATVLHGAEMQGYVEMNPPDDEVETRRDANTAESAP